MTVAELKEYLRVRNTAEDDLITQLYDAALAILERETGEWYGPVKTVTDYLRSGGDVGYLSSTPSAPLTSVEARGETGDWAPVAGSDYEQTGRRMHFLNTETQSAPPERKVVYDTGRAAGAIPDDVWLKIAQLVTLAFEQRIPAPVAFEAQTAVIGFPGGI
jgi:hypothetical protein